MHGIILFIIACLGIWGSALRVAQFIEEACLLDPQRRRLRERFEAWWQTVDQTRPRYFAVALARGISEALNTFFGERLFSKRAFTRSAVVGTGLLIGSLALTGVLNKPGSLVNPWREYERTIKVMKSVADRAPAKGEQRAKDAEWEETAKKIKAIANRFDSTALKIAYCVSFVGIVTASNALLFFLSIGFSRLVLQEIVLAGRFFSTLCLLVLNTFLVLSTASLFLLLITVLAFPALWLVVALVYLLSSASFYWFLAFLFNGGIAVWAFGNASLKAVAIIAILPCLGTMLVCAFSLVAMSNRKRFHQACRAILLRCGDKKPLTFIVGFLGGIAIAIALLCRLL